MSCSVEHCDARGFRDEILSLFDRNGPPLAGEHFLVLREEWKHGRSFLGTSWIGWPGGLRSLFRYTTHFPIRRQIGASRSGGQSLVDEASRGIGGLGLLRSVQSLVSNMQFDVVLGMPTLALPRKVALGTGFRTIAVWRTRADLPLTSCPLLTSR